MKLYVYRIDTSMVGKVFGLLRKTELPPENMVGAGALGGSLFRAVDDYLNYDNHYIIKDKDQLDRFENPLGNSWINKNQYYIRHPKKARERWLIEAEKFHEFIYREQLSDIIAFLRSNLSIKKLVISTENNIDFSLFANLPIEELNLEGKAEAKLKNRKELEINCPQGLKISEKRKEFVWINEFQELLTVVDGFEGGDFRHTIEIENSFGLSVKEAKLLGIGATWLKSAKFEIRFSC